MASPHCLVNKRRFFFLEAKIRPGFSWAKWRSSPVRKLIALVFYGVWKASSDTVRLLINVGHGNMLAAQPTESRRWCITRAVAQVQEIRAPVIAQIADIDILYRYWSISVAALCTYCGDRAPSIVLGMTLT